MSRRVATVVVAALCCVGSIASRAHAQLPIIGGTVDYTGSLGPVSGARPLCLCVYTDPNLQDGLGCLIFSSNNVSYQITLGSPSAYYLIAFLDLQRNEQVDPNEPYEIYSDHAAPPGDPVTAGPSQTHIDFTFGDENLPGAPTPSPLPTDTPTPPEASPTPTPTLTSTATEIVTPTPITTVSPCTGDCDDSGEVTINEIITMVNIALGTADLTACRAGDTDGSHGIEVNEIIQAVNNAASGCAEASALTQTVR